MAKYPKLFLDHMMMQELGLNVLQIEENPLKNGAVTFISFIIFGTIPLLSYLFTLLFRHEIENDANVDFITAIVLTCCSLFGMGAVKGRVNNANVLTSGLFVMLNGCLAAGSAYAIGLGLAALLGVHVPH